MEYDDIFAGVGSIPPRIPEISDGHPSCPTCGERMKWIMYGFPSGPPPEDADYVLGGCVIFAGQPKFICPTCGNL